ncbi:MAG: hypothetical protein H6931_14470 [Burkholderiaceae bacterium]|nr:hypothetical protein [Burkholderiaceae bacterium]MCP5290300.1 hypothetical protein [Burkholderiaceae bacterium]
MSWTTPADLRAQVQRLWDRGELLRAAVADAIDWPLRLSLKVPAPADLSERFDAVRDWVREIGAARHVRLEWREWTHRVQGRQRLPLAAWVDSLDDALALVGKKRQAERFRALWQQTASAQPVLQPWMTKRPLQVLELADRWDRLLAIVGWLQSHPRPGLYLRQVDLPGVDSKFIEAHRGVLAEWLDLALPPGAIDTAAAGAAQFARRYGFLDKPLRIRFRLLDPALPTLPGCKGLADITLDAASFATLALPLRRVVVTENETNFLALPALPQAIVIFGAGYGWDALARAGWLQRCELHYWGDIDTHGFAILDQLRGHFPHAASLLMDRETLLAHRALWGEEPQPIRHDLPRLTVDESAVYDDLRFDRLQPGLRLEQERVGFGWVRERLGRAIG